MSAEIEKEQKEEGIKELTARGAQLGFMEGFASQAVGIQNKDGSPVTQAEQEAFNRAFELGFSKGRSQRVELEQELEQPNQER